MLTKDKFKHRHTAIRLHIIALLMFYAVAVQSQFVTTWKTDNSGTSNNDQITIPAVGNYTVAWEEVGNAANKGTTGGSHTTTITLPSAGTYKISISGALRQIKFANGGDKLKLLTIEKWGNASWVSMESAFYGCKNLTYHATDAPNLTLVTSLASAFRGCEKFNGNINHWNTTKVTHMQYLFDGAITFNQPLNNWRTANVTDMSQMFRKTAFNQPIGNWNVSKVRSMAYMFAGATAFNQPIGSWNTNQVISMQGLFNGATVFNQPIGNWITINAKRMDSMFGLAKAFNQPIGGWDVSRVIRMNNMFSGAIVFNQPIGSWNVGQVTQMSFMFTGAIAFNQDISGWDTKNVVFLDNMFSHASAFNQPIGNWDMSKAFTTSAMFDGASAFNQPIGNWDMSKVTSTYRMFRSALAFNQPIGNWNLENVTTFTGMFINARAFNQDISKWNTSKATDMSHMFSGATIFNQDISQWDVSKVTRMSSMFFGAHKFNQDISQWDVSNVTKMDRMLQFSLVFNQNLGAWNISNVTDMSLMLQDCGIKQSNYDKILIGWAGQNVQSNVALGATGRKYCNAEADRNTLINTKGWNITGDTKECPPIDIEVQLASQEVVNGGTADFGTGITIEKTFTIKNIGSTNALTLSGNPLVKITSGTAFVISEQPNAASIAAGASLTFKVKYTAATADDKGALSIASNDPDEANYIINLKGALKKLDQTITFDLGNDANQTTSSAAFDLVATGGASGNAVTFTSSDPNVATISGNTVTIVGIGTTTITASQAGNNRYNAAPDVTQTLTVQSTVTAVSVSTLTSIQVFPNPVSHMLRIKFNGKQLHDYAEVKVLNHQGKRVLLMGQGMKNGVVEIPVQGLKAGCYLLKITVGEETFTHRIVKQ